MVLEPWDTFRINETYFSFIDHRTLIHPHKVGRYVITLDKIKEFWNFAILLRNTARIINWGNISWFIRIYIQKILQFIRVATGPFNGLTFTNQAFCLEASLFCRHNASTNQDKGNQNLCGCDSLLKIKKKSSGRELLINAAGNASYEDASVSLPPPSLSSSSPLLSMEASSKDHERVN